MSAAAQGRYEKRRAHHTSPTTWALGSMALQRAVTVDCTRARAQCHGLLARVIRRQFDAPMVQREAVVNLLAQLGGKPDEREACVVLEAGRL
jgi:hypothetical protein